MSDSANPSSSDQPIPIPLESVNDGEGLSNLDLPPEAARKIDAICTRFENAWANASGVPPNIEDFWPPPEEDLPSSFDEHLLLKEMLALDLHYRQRRGLSDTLSLEQYFVRFPGCRQLITDAFQSAGLDVSANAVVPSDDDTSVEGNARVPVETASSLELNFAPPGQDDPARFFKTTVNEMPKQLGGYDVLQELGHGGMGVVYRARHSMMKQVVALKVLSKDRTDNEESVARFLLEIEVMARLNHQNIVRANYAGVDESSQTYYVVMDYVEGVDLDGLIRRLGRLSVADACELVRQAAVGLQHAHENELVHRDVKPSNLMLKTNGLVIILDFGLARLRSATEATGGEERLTKAGQVMGTVHYMAPEQAIETHAVDVRADIYSLGCTLYKLLTGQTPYGNSPDATPMLIMVGHVKEPFPKVTDLRPEVPAGLAKVLARLVEKSPDRRPQTPAEVAALLEPFAKGGDLKSLYQRYERGDGPAEEQGSTGQTPRTNRWIRRSICGALVIGLLGMIAFFLTRPKPADPAIDVLAQIDVNRDSVEGKWVKSETGLKSPATPGACLRLPVPMPEEFQLEITAQFESGVNHLRFVHRSSKMPFALVFVPFRAEAVTPSRGSRNDHGEADLPRTQGWNVINPNPQAFLFRVQKDRLVIERDGKPIVTQTGYPPLSEEIAEDVPNRPGFYLWTNGSQFEFSTIRLTPLTTED